MSTKPNMIGDIAKAVSVMAKEIAHFSKDEQLRAVNSLVCLLGVSYNSSTIDNSQPLISTSSVARTGDANSDQMSPKNFMAEKHPKTDVERVACLAYYLTKYRSMSHFKTRDITLLNQEAAQPKLSNPAVAVDNAANVAQYLTSAGSGKKQIGPRGEGVVDALPNRDKVKEVLEKNPLVRRHKKRKSDHKS